MWQHNNLLNCGYIVAHFPGHKWHDALADSAIRLIDSLNNNWVIRESGRPLVVIHLQFGHQIANVYESKKMYCEWHAPDSQLLRGPVVLYAGQVDHEGVALMGHFFSCCRLRCWGVCCRWFRFASRSHYREAEIAVVLYCLLEWDCSIAPNIDDEQDYTVFEELIEKREAEP